MEIQKFENDPKGIVLQLIPYQLVIFWGYWPLRLEVSKTHQAISLSFFLSLSHSFTLSHFFSLLILSLFLSLFLSLSLCLPRQVIWIILPLYDIHNYLWLFKTMWDQDLLTVCLPPSWLLLTRDASSLCTSSLCLPFLCPITGFLLP